MVISVQAIPACYAKEAELRMKKMVDQSTASFPEMVLSNAEIADRLASLAQLLSAQKENPYKVKAYRRAAAKSVAVREH